MDNTPDDTDTTNSPPSKKKSKAGLIVIVVLLIIFSGIAFGVIEFISSDKNNSAAVYLAAVRSKSALDCRITDQLSDLLIKAESGHRKIRSQSTTGEGIIVNALMINDTSYTWNEGELTGSKMTVTPELMEQSLQIFENYYTTAAENDQVVLDCSHPTGLTYDLPANVEFTDY